MAFARGTHALAECDICGLTYPYLSLRKLINNHVYTGLKVCDSCWSEDHPQNDAGKHVPIDPQVINDPRPDRRPEGLTNIRWGWKPIYSVEAKGQVGEIQIDV